jgi:hypothetical protein
MENSPVVEKTIQHHARELAAIFYEGVRAAESQDHKVQIRQRGRILLNIEPKLFAKTYPTLKDYLAGRKHGREERFPDGTIRHIDDGSVRYDTPGWLHWYKGAREQLTEMLSMPQVHQNLKDAIYAALLEDREKELKQTDPRLSPNVTQAPLGRLGGLR